VVERGRQSGVLEATLRDADPVRVAAVLNTIGASYVRQDLERKTAEAEKSLAFVNSQLPGLKAQMDRAEDEYSRFRARKGAVSLVDEAKIALERSSELRGRLADAEQRKTDLLSQFGAMHPSVRIVDEQITGLQRQMRSAQGRVSEMPSTQQDVSRLERDAKLSGDMYQQLRNSAMQLQLIREGRTGNARIIDAAVRPDLPVRPKVPVVMGIAAFAGISLSVLFALLRSGLARGVRDVHEIEAGTGLNVYSSAIPLSKQQRSSKDRALAAPSEPTSVAMRQLRTVLQHQMRDKGNNRLLVTGPSAGVGVHFMAAHLAAAFAGAGRRVLLIDADLRRGSLDRYFGATGRPGLAELVVGTYMRKEVIQATKVARVDLIPSGTASGSLEEFAASRAFQEMLEFASLEYDVVILAAPPVLRSSETLSMVSAAGTVVMVARARKTAIDDIAESARRLTQSGQFPSGVVLNGV
jgi:tyrosine-protein kinase Etk/Wzc